MSQYVNLLDSPGILACPSNPAAALALRSLHVEDGQESAQEAVGTLLKQCNKTQVLIFQCTNMDAIRPLKSHLRPFVLVSDHTSVQYRRLQKYSRVSIPVGQKAWLLAKGWSPEYSAGRFSVSG